MRERETESKGWSGRNRVEEDGHDGTTRRCVDFAELLANWQSPGSLSISPNDWRACGGSRGLMIRPFRYQIR